MPGKLRSVFSSCFLLFLVSLITFLSGTNAYASGLEAGVAFGMFRAYYHAFGTGSSGDNFEYQSIDVSNFPAITTVTNVFSGNNNLADYAQIIIEGDFQDGVTYNIRFADLTCTYGYGEGLINGSMELTNFYVQSNNGNVDLLGDVSGNVSGYQCSTTYTWDGSSDQRIILFFNRTGSGPNYDTYVQWVWSSFIMSVNVNSQTGANVSGILNIITQIWNSIQSIPGTLQSIITNIANIPNLIVEKLEAAIIPDPDNMKALVDDFQKYFVGDENDPNYPPRLGFLGTIFDKLVTFFERMEELNETPVSVINFPGIKLPGSVVQNNEDLLQEDENGDLVFYLAQPVAVDLDDYAGPDGIDIIQYVRIATSFIIIISLVNMAQNELNAFLNDHVNF